MADSIKLLSFWSSPFALRVQLALKLKGLDYELQEEDLSNRKSDLLLQSNPVYQKIPVLIHNGKPICESMLIVQYLDEVWPEDGNRPGFLPLDPFARATARFWADFVDKNFLGRESTVFRAAFCTGAEKEKAKEEFVQAWMQLEDFLGKSEDDGPFFAGNTIGYVDIALSFLPFWMPPFAEAGLSIPDAEESPRIYKWMEAVKSSPHAAVVFPDQETLNTYIRERVKAHKA